MLTSLSDFMIVIEDSSNYTSIVEFKISSDIKTCVVPGLVTSINVIVLI